MITKEQFVNGLITYLDREVIPQLPTSGKWYVGTVAFLATTKTDIIFSQLQNTPMVKMLGIIDQEGLIDVDALATALKQSAEKYGKLQIIFPILGTMTFSSTDVDKLRTYMTGGME